MADVSEDVDELVRLAFPSEEPNKVWTEEADRVVERLRQEAAELRASACLDVAKQYEALAGCESEGPCDIEAEVEDLPDTLRGVPDGWIQELKQLVLEKQQVETKLQELRDLETSDTILSELKRRHERLGAQEEEQTLEDRAKLVLEQWKQLKTTDSDHRMAAHAEALHGMKDSAAESIQAIHHQIATHLEQAVVFQTGGESAPQNLDAATEGWISVTSSGLKEILAAARALEKSNDIVEQLIGKLEHEFAGHAFPCSKTCHVNMWAETETFCRLHWKKEALGENSKAENIVACFKQSVDFFSKHLFLDEAYWCRCFVQAYWQRIINVLLNDGFMTATISEKEELNEVCNFMQHIETLSSTLSEKYGCPCDPTEMIRWGVGISKSYYDKTLLEILDQVRQAYMSKESYVVHTAAEKEAVTLSSCPFEDLEVYLQEGGARAPVIEKGGYAVTLGGTAAVKAISKVMHEVLYVADLGFHEDLIMYLFDFVSDIVLLVLELPPGRYGTLLDESPRLCLLYGNDCEHVARALIPWAYAIRWQVGGDVCLSMLGTLEISVQGLYSTSENTSSKQLEKRVAAFSGALKSIGSFCSFTELKKNALLKGLSQIAESLSQLQVAWNSILPAHIYVEMIGSLLKCTGSYIFEAVLRVDDLSINDCNQLQSSLLEFLEAVEEGTVASSQSKKGTRSGVHDFQRLRRFMGAEWKRLEALTDLLGDKLRDIVEKWELGELQDQGWSAEQLQKFVQMVFSETPRREEALLRIQKRDHSEP
eukprot:CAMPEP_0183827218 /NCGR_PEP_ID=MMETSP0807_2-20130328/2129_1 /TAXON_ID=88271 /ORGANISM="Picocystis salinarum, Strain CCMP1897" /LENGTH=765 /DNA_ID=CAMNT_0026072375 /DNA_START=56 /DNA_END=2353 /DNA_ORIENTATION=-